MLGQCFKEEDQYIAKQKIKMIKLLVTGQIKYFAVVVGESTTRHYAAALITSDE